MSSCVLKFIILPVFCTLLLSRYVLNKPHVFWLILYLFQILFNEISDFHFKRCQEKTLRIYTKTFGGKIWRNLHSVSPGNIFDKKFNRGFFYISHQKLSRLNLVPNKNWKFQCFPSNMILHQLYLFRNIVDSNFFGTRRSAKQKHPDKA